MVALVWTALNIVLFLLIGYAWVKVFQVLKRQVGVGLSFLFLLSLVSFRGREETEPAKNLLSSAKPVGQVGNWSAIRQVKLSPTNELSILAEGKRTENGVKPYGLYTTTSGVVIGHEWKPQLGVVQGGSGQLQYHIVMLHEWKLLGMKVYANSEEYTGQIPVQ